MASIRLFTVTLLMLSASALSAQTIYSESFEGGSVPAGWTTQPGANKGWSVTAATAQSGTYSLQSDDITNNQSAGIDLTIETPAAQLAFGHYWNADAWDHLYVYVNDVLVYQTVYNVTPRGWMTAPAILLDAGTNKISFVYRKNPAGSSACDCVRIDNIQIISRDQDLDGMPDQWETDNGLNPNDAADALLDLDSDGLNNLGEFNNNTDPQDSDSDDDGLTDGDEVNVWSTNPLMADSDGDAIPDGWETMNGTNPLFDDALADPDGDFLQNIGEYRLGFDPQDPASVASLNPGFTENFESGSVPAGWQVPINADAGWEITNVTARSGTFSLQNENISDNEVAKIVFPLFTPAAKLSFWHYWNADRGDTLRVLVNGTAVYNSGSIRGWTTAPTILLDAGYNEVEFVFDKDSSVSRYCDCVRIDDVVLTLRDADFDLMLDDWEIENGLNPNDPNDALLDADGDGLNNLGEFENNTDPNDTDTDDDGLSDGSELLSIGTDPLNTDSDSDTLPDGWEFNNGLNPLDNSDPFDDDDGDGLNNLGEFELGFDPQNPLSVPVPTRNMRKNFDNGLTPAVFTTPESATTGWSVTADDPFEGSHSFVSNFVGGNQNAQFELSWFVEETELRFAYTRTTASNHPFRVYVDGVIAFEATGSSQYEWTESPAIPLSAGYHKILFSFERVNSNGALCNCVKIDSFTISKADGDGDLIPDYWELRRGLNPLSAADAFSDPDSDGLNNTQEYGNNTFPLDADSDDDGLNDGYEVNTSGTNPLDADSDGDSLPDGWEDANGLNPLNSFDAVADTDLDGLNNLGEYRLNYDPQDKFSVPPLNSSYFESFEGGAVPPNWLPVEGVDKGWFVTDVTADTGTYSLQNSHVNRGEKAEVLLPLFAEASTLNFRHYWNAISNSGLQVYRNDVLVYQAFDDAPRGWASAAAIELVAGYNEIRFVYFKGSNGYACDCVRIDNIQLTSRDVDIDWMPDAWELENGLNPGDPTDGPMDSDSDGLVNSAEFIQNTDPMNPDSDNDGLLDGDEVNNLSTDPLDPDTDDDLITDGWEVNNGLDPRNANDALLDNDVDGLNNLGEFRFGYDPNDDQSIAPLTTSLFEGFESGSLASPTWVTPTSTARGWVFTSTTANSGAFSLVTPPNMLPGETAEARLQVFTPAASLTFWHYWNTYISYPLEVYVNGVLAYESAGRRTWYPSTTIPLSAGYNEIVFSYDRKFSGGATGCRCIRIDDVQIVAD